MILKCHQSIIEAMNINPAVDAYLEKKAHPLTPEIQRVREIILNAHPGIEETIKWSSPTFMYKGNMASYFMKAKKHVSLMFHKGAMIQEASGILEGDGKEGRSAKFFSMEDIEAKKEELEKEIEDKDIEIAELRGDCEYWKERAERFEEV